MIFRQLFDSTTSTFTYIVGDARTRHAAIIDSVKENSDRDLKLLKELDLKLKTILETHIHADHITGAHILKTQTGAQTWALEGVGVDEADQYYHDQTEISVGDLKIKVITTPGHTDSCSCFLLDDRIFTGDTLFIRGCGRTDFQQGSASLLFNNVREKIFTLAEDTLVYPGHDYKGMTCSTVGEEKKYNPRLGLDKSLEDFEKIMNGLNLAPPARLNEAVPANLKLGNS